MTRRTAFTLIELLVVVTMMTILLVGTWQVTFTAFNHGERVKASRTNSVRDALFEDRVRSLIERACLSSLATDSASYFIGSDGSEESTLSTSGPALIFTALNEKLPSNFVESTDDFETVNEVYGPRGGLSEVSIGTTAIGEGATGEGLFLRTQTPADGDPEQGGNESLLDPDISTISYEFYDGTQWITVWDSREGATPRIPSAVRITYRRNDDDTDRFIVVRLPHSDITPDNPLEGEAAQ